MKSHTVKSNAKRAARKLCDQFAGIEPAEPVPAPGGEWFPAVRLTGGLLPKDIGDQISAVAEFVVPEPATAPLPFESTTGQAAALVEQTEIAKLAQPTATTDTHAVADDDAEIPAFLRARKLPEPEPAKADTQGIPGPLANYLTYGKPTVAELAKSIPQTKSTPEEIAERRRQRQERIAAEKQNPQPKPERATKTRELMSMLQQEGGATAEAIREKLGWLPHTLRGFISTLKSKGVAIETVRNGKVTSYKLAAVDEAANEVAA